MGDKNMHSPQDQLLAEALDACMEEQLSFVPPEREIARMHQFSQEFQKRMEKLLQTGGRAPGKKLEKREFIYGFNRIAAGILLFLIVGGVGYLGLSMVEKGNSKKEAAYDEAAPAEEPDSSGMQEDLGEGPGHSQNQQTGADAPTGENGTDWGTKEETPEAEEPGSGQNIPDGEYLGRMLKPGVRQSLPEKSGLVKTLVNSPLIARDAQELLVTIGNMEDYPIRYYAYMDLEVYIDGYWYLLPPLEEPSEEDARRIVSLEPGMAQDEVIDLSNYDLDYEAENYRIVTYLDGMTLCAQFRFEEEELFGEEEEP
ncbi:MAG: hypothetical protein HFI30_01200 [Lachnospiraceae bacterium]|jgi:hypothetical protein|nr:hypothetical protein [Lachnospiraceae bacterium]MCI8994293.1 hypothetical protein [Lachnospiraceae bacterium]